MNVTEAGRILALIQARYPNANFGAERLAARSWAMSLCDVPYEAVEWAAGRWFQREKWPPDPSELRQLVLTALGAVPEAEAAWASVVAHIRRHGMVSGVAYDGSDVTRQAVEAIGGWWVLRTSEQPGKDRDAFLRAYATYAKRAMTDADVAALWERRGAELTGRGANVRSLEGGAA